MQGATLPTDRTIKFYDVVKRTALERSDGLSHQIGSDVYLKREDNQTIHSFKIRGALKKLLELDDRQLAAGVVAASAGNHAQGVALGAQLLGASALIVMPQTTPDIKIKAVKSYGAEVVLHGENYSEAYDYCQQLGEASGRTFIHPFDDPVVIKGQGTIGLEIIEQLPEVDYVFVPVGGGGLLAGIAEAIKAVNPAVKIIGVEPDDSNAMTQALEAGHPVELPQVGIFADGVAVKRVGDRSFELAQRYVDDMVNVSTKQIAQAIKQVFEDNRAILEPAGALAMAGLQQYVAEHEVSDKKLVAICSGANISFEKLGSVASYAS